MNNRNIFLSSLKLNINDIPTDPKLIMGFGPSASGKTYCAKSIIKILKSTDGNFPSVFMTIDGGIYREESIIYQLIINSLKYHKLAGLNNMKISGFSLKYQFPKLQSLFDSTNIKKVVGTFLEQQKSKISSISLSY